MTERFLGEAEGAMLRAMNQRVREFLVFAVLFALPFASAAVVEWWATFLFCPLGVIGLIGLNETLGGIRVPGMRRRGGAA